MAKSTPRTRAVNRMRELLGELKLLTATFPDLHDSFDDDDLPIAFLIRRDAAAATRKAPGVTSGSPARRARKAPALKAQRGRIKT